MDPEVRRLPISCTVLTTIEKVIAPVQLGDDDLLDWLCTLLLQSIRHGSYQGKESLLETYSRIILCNELRDSFSLLSKWHISQQECEIAITALLNAENADDIDLSNSPELRFFRVSSC